MRKIITLFFFASGCTALIYEITWIRLLRYFFGNTVYTVSTVLTVFMAGLALGSYLIGRLSDRFDRPFSIYGILEVLIGLSALLFLILLDSMESLYIWIEQRYDLTYTSFSLIKFLLAFLMLIPPTTLMGGTLPVIAKSFSKSRDHIGEDVGLLYGANVLGAVMGCSLSAFVLIKSLGINNSIYLAVTVNALIGIVVLLLVLSGREIGGRISERAVRGTSRAEPEYPADTGIDPVLSSERFKYWALALSAFSGFTTMALEVFWTRTYISMLSANTLVFAVLLASFLCGLALGSLLISRWIDQVRNITRFIGVLLLVNGASILATTLSLKEIGSLFEYLHRMRSVSPLIDNLGVWSHFSVLFVIILIPTTAMGTIFPAVIKLCAGSISRLGKDVGRVYAVNTVGAIFGSFISGFLLTPLLGTNRSILILSGIYGLLAAITFGISQRKALRIAGYALTGLSLAFIPLTRSPHWFNAGFIRTRIIPADETPFFEEGISANVGVIQRDGFKALTVDGIIVAQNTKEDLWDLLLKAHLPMLLHADPRKVLIIGLGGGISLGAVEKYDVEEIDCVELSPEVVRAHRQFAEENDRCWEDSRLNLIINDGRHFLLTTAKRYDIISVDPVDPPVSTLYTRDFFGLCRDALNEGGLMLQWVPLFRLSTDHVLMILNSFQKVFPNTTIWYDGTSIFLLGRKGEETQFAYSSFLSRFSHPEVRRSLAKIGVTDPHLVLATFVGHVEEFHHLMQKGVPENSDDHPRLEYSVLLARGHAFHKNLELIIDHYRCISPFLSGPEADIDTEAVEKACLLMSDLLQVRILVMKGRVNEAAHRLESLAARHDLNMEDVERLKPFWKP